MPYALLDTSCTCINIVVYDESSSWQPPDGQTLAYGDSFIIGQQYQEDSESGKWFETSPVPRQSYEQAASTVRTQRNERLAKSDWTQLADAPVDAGLWAIYRQALRDIPAQDGFPWEIVWPSDP